MPVKPRVSIYHVYVALWVTTLFYGAKVHGQGTCTSTTIPQSLCDCFIQNNEKVISCRYKNLTEIPKFSRSSEVYDKLLFSSTEETADCDHSLQCNRITNIPARAFENIPVKYIDLQKNPISTVDEFAFDGTQSYLRVLLLEGTGTNTPPYDAMEDLTNLEKLHLRNYRQTTIASPSRFLMPNLTSLTMENFDGLTTIEQSRFNPLTKLEEFHLKTMQSMTEVPVQAISQLRGSLKILDIEDTGITQIYSQSFADLTKLLDLKIHQNIRLTRIDNGAFSGLPTLLEYLFLNANNIGEGDTSNNILGFLNEGSWQKLSHLNLGYNDKIGNIQGFTFANMGSLDYLDIQDIGLTTVDNTMFTGLTSLHTLDISYNIITQIQNGAFQGCPNLVELRMSDQQIGSSLITFGDNAFSDIENSLQHLLIENNKFSLSPFWTKVSRLTQLLELNIDNIGLSDIPDKAFKYNDKLEKIYASNNNIMSINQLTFFGPKSTLKEIHLSNNKLPTVGICVLYDFPARPVLTITGNPLVCDCGLVWLYNWMNDQPNPTDAAYLHIGTCAAPQALSGSYFIDFTKSEMCPGGNDPIANCPDSYATTTTSTTTTTTTMTTTTEKPPPVIPDFSLTVLHKGEDYITLTWTISDKSEVTGYRLEMKANYLQNDIIKNIHRDENSYTFNNLPSQTSHTFCLYIGLNNVIHPTPSCQFSSTLAPLTTSTMTAPVTEAQGSNTAIIAGAVAGGVIFVIIIVVIVFVLLKANKAPKAMPPAYPVSFTRYPGTPQAGGTAKRFAKPGKEGATPDDIDITVISNGDMTNRDRISAGSYQFLNEKGVDNRPMPSTSNGGGYSHPANPSYGHYTNAVEDRPLPKAPNGKQWSGGGTSHGYVNDTMVHKPETSTNEYSEVNSNSPSVF